MAVQPVLIALGAVAWVEDDVTAGVVQTGLVSPYLALFRHHPVLREMKYR